jgi:hypothetical protein
LSRVPSAHGCEKFLIFAFGLSSDDDLSMLDGPTSPTSPTKLSDLYNWQEDVEWFDSTITMSPPDGRWPQRVDLAGRFALEMTNYRRRTRESIDHFYGMMATLNAGLPMYGSGSNRCIDTTWIASMYKNGIPAFEWQGPEGLYEENKPRHSCLVPVLLSPTGNESQTYETLKSFYREAILTSSEWGLKAQVDMMVCPDTDELFLDNLAELKKGAGLRLHVYGTAIMRHTWAEFVEDGNTPRHPNEKLSRETWFSDKEGRGIWVRETKSLDVDYEFSVFVYRHPVTEYLTIIVGCQHDDAIEPYVISTLSLMEPIPRISYDRRLFFRSLPRSAVSDAV